MAKTKKIDPNGVFEMVPINIITSNRNNPRKHMDQHALDELAASLKEFGIIEPLIIRNSKDPGYIYEVVCGDRRYSAANRVGMEEVPCIIKELTDDQAFELSITENLQRKDINVMEESNAFAKLIEKGLKTADMIADKFGVSTKYVYDRLALQNVIDPVKEGLEEGNLTISHGKQFARLSKTDQEKLWEAVSTQTHLEVKQLKDLISRTFTLQLDMAPFDLESKTLDKKAGACLNCSKRSGCNLMLFDDVDSHDICFDKACYDRKVQAHVDTSIKKLKKEGKEVKLLSTCYRSADYLACNDWDEVVKESPDYEKINVYGIIMETTPYQNLYKLGQVIKIEVLADEDDDQDDTDKSPMSRGISQLIDSKPPTVDWPLELCNSCIEAVLKRYTEHGLTGPGLQNALIDKARQLFNQLADDTAGKVCKFFHWDIINKNGTLAEKEEDINQVETFKNAFRGKDLTIIEIRKLIHLLYVLNECDMYICDKDEYDQVNNILAAEQIDLQSILHDVEERAGKKILDFELEETE